MENCPFTDILNKLSERLGCSNTPFAIQEQKPGQGFYVRKLPLYGSDGKVLEEHFLTLPENDGFFLRAAADCVADSIERREVSLSDPHAFSDNGEEVPLSSLAESYHASLHRWLALSFKRMYGICFETINRLSASPYEGDAAQGVLAFLPLLTDGEDGALSKLLRVDFQPENRPVFSTDYIKQVRKVFAGAGNGAMLVVRENSTPEGMRCRGYLNRENVLRFPYYAELRGPYQWTLYEGCIPLFNIEFDRCKIYQDPLETAMDALCQEFQKTSEEFTGPVRGALESVSRQRHGATLLFLDLGDEDVKKRIDHLIEYQRAIAIVPLPLSQCAELLTGLGRIDGAIVVDISTCTVPCIGTLLDGETAVAGDPARGSRHNSISTLFSSLVAGCRQEGRPIIPQGAAAIFSEDGGCRVMAISGVAEQMGRDRVPVAAHQA